MFRARPVTLRRLLAGQYHYRLPRFQRHYAWTEKVVTKLFHDLQAARGEQSPSGGPRTTFLGAIIVIESSTPGATDRLLGRKQFDILDGQQRLITLTMMLAIIRDHVPAAAARSIQRTIAGNNPSEVPYRLTLRKVDEELFTRLAKDRGATKTNPKVNMQSDSARNMITNRDLLRDLLVEMDEDGQQLQEFAKYLLDHCQIALIEADHHDDGNQIYESLNHGGVPLHITSHIKTFAFKDTPEGDPTFDALAAKWDSWERSLTIRRFNRLFSILRAIHTKGRQPVAMVHADIIKKVGGCKPYLDTIVEPAVNGFLRVLNAADGKGDDNAEVRKYLTYLNWLRDTDWVGPVIRWFQIGPDDDEQTIEFLRRLDRLAFGLLFLGTSVAERATRFKQVLDQITPEGIPASSTVLDLSRSEQSTILYRLSNNFHKKGGRSCKLALVRVSDVLGGEITRQIPPDLTIEHTLPQTVNDNPEWTKHFSSIAEMQLCAKRFANMVLLPKHINERIENEPFDIKVDRIFRRGKAKTVRKTPYALTNFLLECEAWNAEVIDKREDELFAIIKDIWDLKGKSGRELDKKKSAKKTPAKRKR